MRATWDEYCTEIAHVVKKRSTCSRRQIGAVIIDSDHRIVGTGYNGAPPGEAHCIDGGCPRGLLTHEELPPGAPYDNCVAIHAEVNAIRQALKVAVLHTCEIYVTDDPCSDCQEDLDSFGISLKVVKHGDPITSEPPIEDTKGTP